MESVEEDEEKKKLVFTLSLFAKRLPLFSSSSRVRTRLALLLLFFSRWVVLALVHAVPRVVPLTPQRATQVSRERRSKNMSRRRATIERKKSKKQTSFFAPPAFLSRLADSTIVESGMLSTRKCTGGREKTHRVDGRKESQREEKKNKRAKLLGGAAFFDPAASHLLFSFLFLVQKTPTAAAGAR